MTKLTQFHASSHFWDLLIKFPFTVRTPTGSRARREHRMKNSTKSGEKYANASRPWDPRLLKNGEHVLDQMQQDAAAVGFYGAVISLTTREEKGPREWETQETNLISFHWTCKK